MKNMISEIYYFYLFQNLIFNSENDCLTKLDVWKLHRKKGNIFYEHFLHFLKNTNFLKSN